MNAIFYHEDNCFIDYDIGNLLRKNDFFTESITNVGALLSSILVLKAKLVIIKSNQKYIQDIINEKYLKETLFNNVKFITFDASRAADMQYKRAFYDDLEKLIMSMNENTISKYNIFNLDQHLIDLGLKPKYRGYHFLKDCIKYSVFLNQYKKLPMSKIYEKVAEKHNTTAKNVERLVRLMILKSLKKADIKELSKRTGIHEEYFKNPTTTNAFIEIICGYLDFYL